MEDIKTYKAELEKAYNKLSDSRKEDIKEFYGCFSHIGVTNEIMKDIRNSAQSTIEYADRHCYGYGEVGYNLNEDVKDFAEDVPELEKHFKRLQHAYFEFLIESKNI